VAAALALICVPLAIALAFLWAPTATIAVDGGTQDDVAQKIFYLHVPIAFAAYWSFAVGAWNAALYLWRRDDDFDVRSYVGVHVGVVFGTLVLATGSIWAKAAWGHWWEWSDRQLLVFLILYLFYCAYFMLRFSLDAGSYRARASAVFALLGVGLVPMSFLAVRIADTLIHPTVIKADGLQMTAEMGTTFIIGVVGFLALASCMMQLEVAAKLLAIRGHVTRRVAA
jgi:heme exporter protein C